MAKVTILRHGYLVPPIGATERQKIDMQTMIPLEYIVQQIKKFEVPKSVGDRIFVIKGGTGSGKSISVPPALMFRGKRIAVTEPTKLIAEEVAYDLAVRAPGLKFGESLGYHTGVVNKSAPRGVIVMTPGILLQHILTIPADQLMRRYSTWIIDEVHRHDLVGEFLLRACKMFIETNWRHPDCPVLILMSATIEMQDYGEYFETPHMIEITGQSGAHPVTEHWPAVAPTDLEKVIVQLCDELKGDTLVFIPTTTMIKSLEEKMKSKHVIQLYSEILEKTSDSKELQHESKIPRIILATNVAESGVTFKFLDNVIDTGYTQNVLYDPSINATVSYPGAVSKASAIQRRGRVGRQRPGNWYPLYKKEVFDAMSDQAYPEVFVADISDQLLRFIMLRTGAEMCDGIKCTGNFDPADLRLMHTPSSEMIQRCMEKLYVLGMIDSNWRPTLSGVIASQLTTLNTNEARFILSGIHWGVEPMHAIVIACAACISRSKKLGSLANKYGLICGFTDLLLTYERLIDKINIAEIGADLSPKFIEDWCAEQGLEYGGWLAVLELVDETVLQLLEVGLPIPHWSQPRKLSDDLDAKDQSDIYKIKNALLEAYRPYLCSWNSKIESYVTDQQQKIGATLAAKPQLIICNAIEFTRGKFKCGKLISAMDGWVDVDRRFMY